MAASRKVPQSRRDFNAQLRRSISCEPHFHGGGGRSPPSDSVAYASVGHAPPSGREYRVKLARSLSQDPASHFRNARSDSRSGDQTIHFDDSSSLGPVGGKIPQSRRQFNSKLLRSVSQEPGTAERTIRFDERGFFAPVIGDDQSDSGGVYHGDFSAARARSLDSARIPETIHEGAPLNNNFNSSYGKYLQPGTAKKSTLRQPPVGDTSCKSSENGANRSILRQKRQGGEKTSTKSSQNTERNSRTPSPNYEPIVITAAPRAAELTPLNMFQHKFQSAPFSAFDAFVALCSIGSYLFDVGTDVYLVLLYFHQRHMWWFTLTLIFILGPAFIMSSFSLKWYIADYKFRRSEAKEVEKGYRQLTGDDLPQIIRMEVVSVGRWIARTVFLMLQISPVLRYIDMLIFGWRSRNAARPEREFWFREMVFEETDSAFLRLFECFLEAAPQLVLQLYIMTHTGAGSHILEYGPQVLSVLASWISLSWGLVNYHRSLRISIPDKAEMKIPGMAFQFVWRLLTIGARVLALAMFASYFQLWLFVVITSHWIVMFIWIKLQYTNFCDTKSQEVFYNLVIATVCIFCFFNVKEGHTRLRCAFYYGLVYVENIFMVTVWWMMTQTQTLWYHLPVIFAVVFGMPLGVALMLIYYTWYHPNNYLPDKSRKIKMWVPWNQLHCLSDPVEIIVEKEKDSDLTPYTKMPLPRKSRGSSICYDASEVPDFLFQGSNTIPRISIDSPPSPPSSSDSSPLPSSLEFSLSPPQSPLVTEV